MRNPYQSLSLQRRREGQQDHLKLRHLFTILQDVKAQI